MEIKIEYKERDVTSKEEYVNKNILIPYGQLAAEKASNPISIYDSSILMDVEREMCLKILNVWEINKYGIDPNLILDKNIFVNRDKFIYKMFLGKILRLIPGGVTILSIGINSSLARRFTQALGYSISKLCLLYTNKIINKENVTVEDVFTKESLEDLMESYLIEYNKTVSN